MRVIAEGTVLGCEERTNKKTGERYPQTTVAIEDRTYGIRGNGFVKFDQVLVIGDLRTYEGRQYFADGARMMPAPSDKALDMLLDLAKASK